jgi:hypothetical protein
MLPGINLVGEGKQIVNIDDSVFITFIKTHAIPELICRGSQGGSNHDQGKGDWRGVKWECVNCVVSKLKNTLRFG